MAHRIVWFAHQQLTIGLNTGLGNGGALLGIGDEFCPVKTSAAQLPRVGAIFPGGGNNSFCA